MRVQEEKGELINRILEVIDNLERAIDSTKNYRHSPFFDGILSYIQTTHIGFKRIQS